MKAAEEYLIKYLIPMLNRIDNSYVSIDEMKETPEWDITIKAIKQAQIDAYNQALKDVVENASSYTSIGGNKHHRIDSESILKLKK